MPVFDIDGNELATSQGAKLFFWMNENNAHYWILHLDCARKYFSVSNVKTLIDLISNAGFNQIQLHFSENEGFRFALDNMVFSANGTQYDLTPCLGGTESSTKWYTQSDMDTIIAYAHIKGIDVVPSFDMPGHMGRILQTFTQFKLNNSNTLNIKSEAAVNFAKSLVNAYAEYFAERGCKYYNIGYDEIIGWAQGFHQFYNNGEFQYVVDFANELADILKSKGMTPRLFNEPPHYNNDFSFFVNRDFEVLYWAFTIPNETVATAETLMNLGYTVINSSAEYYWVLGGRQVTAEMFEQTDLLTYFRSGTTSKDGQGAQFCIWCDSTSTQAGDNGDGVVASVTPLIAAFGDAIERALQ